MFSGACCQLPLWERTFPRLSNASGFRYDIARRRRMRIQGTHYFTGVHYNCFSSSSITATTPLSSPTSSLSRTTPTFGVVKGGNDPHETSKNQDTLFHPTIRTEHVDLDHNKSSEDTAKNLHDSSSLSISEVKNDLSGHGDLTQELDYVMAPRLIKIKRKQPPMNQELNNGENDSISPKVKNSNNHKAHFDGYKYRILSTPSLATDYLEPPISNLEQSSLVAPNPHSSSMEKDDDFGLRLEQNVHSQSVSKGTKTGDLPQNIDDILSSHWWRTLYQNILQPQSTSASRNNSQHPFSPSLRSRRSSLLLEEIINNDSFNGFIADEHQRLEEEKITARIRVRSVQAASSIDVVAVLSKVFGGGSARVPHHSQFEDGTGNSGGGGEEAMRLQSSNGKSNNTHAKTSSQYPLADFFASSAPLRHVFGRTNIIIQLSPPPSNCPPSLAPSVPRYIAIYRFGSVVFFNITTKEASRLLEQIKKHAVDPIAVGFERREHFEMALQPQLETATGKITPDRAMVRELDMNTVGVISNIMGQTVALDWHNDTVDELLANFSNINSSVERTGNFTSMERHTLFQVVARNNSLFIDMVGKLGIKDRSDTAWHLSQYEGLHEGMRKEFDLDERFRVSFFEAYLYL